MLDDRNQTVSASQFVGIGVWDRGSNETGWAAYLGERYGTNDVPIYAAAARANDLSGLPPAFIDVASAEVFRDEAVAYASQIWADGGVAELHVWPGGFHGFRPHGPTRPDLPGGDPGPHELGRPPFRRLTKSAAADKCDHGLPSPELRISTTRSLPVGLPL